MFGVIRRLWRIISFPENLRKTGRIWPISLRMVLMKSLGTGLSDFGIAFYPLNPRDPRFFILCVNSCRFVIVRAGFGWSRGIAT